MKSLHPLVCMILSCIATASSAQEPTALHSPATVQRTESSSQDVLSQSPISLHAFRTTAGVQLSWTSNESDKKVKFIVESGIDGETFTGNGVVTSGKQKSFQFMDQASGNASRYYRIRAEKDGVPIATSESFMVASVEEKPFSMYPLETEGELFADLFIDLKGQSMRVIVKDAEGEIHVSRQVPIESNLGKIKILSGRDGLKPGVYQVSMAFKNRTFSDTITVK